MWSKNLFNSTFFSWNAVIAEKTLMSQKLWEIGVVKY